MGSQQSTPRRLSIPNDSPIKVSQAVAERLSNTDKVCADPPLVGPDTPKVNKENVPPQKFGKASDDRDVALQEKEADLRESEKYWTNRIAKMEQHHKHVSDVYEREYEKALKELHVPPKRQIFKEPPCSAGRQKVLECYKKNPNQVLLCAGEVTAFQECVDDTRMR